MSPTKHQSHVRPVAVSLVVSNVIIAAPNQSVAMILTVAVGNTVWPNV